MSQPTLAQMRRKWLEAFSGADKNSITNQIVQMAWDAACFRVVNEARRLAPDDPEGGVQLNGLMHSLLDRSFFISQMAAVRRLMDGYSLDGARGVYSLTGLLEDLRKHHHLLTRQAIFDAEGLQYDYEQIKQAAKNYSLERVNAGEKAWCMPSNLNWRRHEMRHQQIDRLTGADPLRRQPSDTVCKEIFGNLFNKVKSASRDIVDYVNKFIAHGATPESRLQANIDETNVTLGHIWGAHRNLCEVVGFLSMEVLGDGQRGFLPVPQYNQFKYIERPLIDATQIGELVRLWDEIDGEYGTWGRWGLDEYELEFGQLAGVERRDVPN